MWDQDKFTIINFFLGIVFFQTWDVRIILISRCTCANPSIHLCYKGMCQVSLAKLNCHPCCTFTSLVKSIECLQTLILSTKQWVYKLALLPYCVTFLNKNNLLYTKHHALPHLSRIYLALLNNLSQVFPPPSM